MGVPVASTRLDVVAALRDYPTREDELFATIAFTPRHGLAEGHPGIPCVFWRHFFDQSEGQKAQLIKLIAIRKKAGITSRSGVFIEPNTDGKYAAIIDGKLAMKLGPAPWSPGEGWDVALDGPDYAVWTKTGP
jgi:Alpha-amylase C-terminal beta-sheet domain